MSLFSIFKAAQTNDDNAILILYNKFLPKIKKCSRSLNYETAETDLTIRFLEFIKNTNFDTLISKCDGAIVNYTNRFFVNTYVNLLKLQKCTVQIVYLDDDNNFMKDIPYYDEINSFENIYFLHLTELQRKIIVLKYIYGYSDQEIANGLKISRQAVNRTKNRGIKIIKENYEKT